MHHLKNKDNVWFFVGLFFFFLLSSTFYNEVRPTTLELGQGLDELVELLAVFISNAHGSAEGGVSPYSYLYLEAGAALHLKQRPACILT